MTHAHFKLILAASALIGAIDAAPPSCPAEEVDTACNCGSNYWSNCVLCRCFDRCSTGCDRICQFRVVDDCTKCAWSRTWHAPNALATPLREYYVPRPAQCCSYSSCAAGYGKITGVTWETPCGIDCQNRITLTSAEVSPDASAGFSPAQFERLGTIRNELDVGGPAPSRAAAPVH
jgi:hypothetical protein